MTEAPRYRFTVRQRQVLELVAAGKSYKAVAAVLGISRRTVEAHAQQVALRIGYAHLPPQAALRQYLHELGKSTP